MSFLHDPTTQFLILCAIGVLTILVPWIIYLKQRGRKEIAYEIISNTSVVSIEGEAKGKVQVLYDGKPVNEANLLLLRVWNSGNLPIPAEDYKEPLTTFTFGKEIEILDVEVVEKYPVLATWTIRS